MSPFLHHISLQKENEKQPKYDIFSIVFVPVCRIRPTKILISQVYPKLRIMEKKGHFHDTSATCPECLPIRLMRYRPIHVSIFGLMPIQYEREKLGKKYGYCVICVSAQRTSHQDGLFSDPTVRKVTHYPQITVSMTNVQNVHCCELEHCCVEFSLSWSTLLPSEYTSGKQNPCHIICFWCYLNLCLQCT